jgi:MFS family permease
MTQTAKLDLARADQRGLAIGLNEFSGYVGVAIAGIVTGYAATALGARTGLLVFGLAVVTAAIVLAAFGIRDTLSFAAAESRSAAGRPRARYPRTTSPEPGGREIFAIMSWRDRRMAAICQAGLVEKFVDALVWVILPVHLYRQGVDLAGIGWIVGVYGFVWGGAQLFTGRLSDHIGRKVPNVAGMWICGAGTAMLVLSGGYFWWSLSAAVTGFGMALLYPNLSAAVADIAPPAWRGTAIGIYRFWRDLGYGVGALALGIVAHFSGAAPAAFWFVAVAMFLSGALLWWLGEETHPRLNPAPDPEDAP